MNIIFNVTLISSNFEEIASLSIKNLDSMCETTMIIVLLQKKYFSN